MIVGVAVGTFGVGVMVMVGTPPVGVAVGTPVVPVAVGTPPVGVAVGLPAVGVAVGVGGVVAVGVGPVAEISKIACAVRANDPEPLEVAGKSGDPLPENGAGISPNARVNPSLVELTLKRLFSELESVTVGASAACEP
jgi:hypothetical protein